MTFVALVLAWAVAVAVLIPALVFLTQVLAASTPARAAAGPALAIPLVERGSVAVLMPAHNEREGIASSIAAVRTELGPKDRLLVVADNCSDDTADIARDAGAEVVIRSDPGRRGKGYALDHGLQWMAGEPPDVVVVVDADCHIAPGAIDLLAQACYRSGRPAQALYRMELPAEPSLRARVGAFAWIVKNEVRPRGGHRLGMPCPLMGTGMAFTWATLADAPVASGHLVEDMQLGTALALRGTAPALVAEAVVSSTFPSDVRALQSQRTRWEHGHLSLIASSAPALALAAVVRRQASLAAMVLDLTVPPLASLTLAILAGLGFAGLVAFGTGNVLPLAMVGVAGAATATAGLLAWHRFGRRVLTSRQLLGIPGYVLAKAPLYGRLFGRRQVEWVRTERDRREP